MRRLALGLLLCAGGCQAILGFGDTTLAMPDAESADAPLGEPPDGPLPDAPLPDAPLPDAPLPDARRPDAPRPDAPIADARLADGPQPDVRPVDSRGVDAHPAPDACSVCTTSASCGESAPICQACACTTCTTDPQCAARAAAAGTNEVLCGALGRCVQCRDDSACGGATPICDPSGQCIAPTMRACGSVNITAGAIATAPNAAYDIGGSLTLEAWVYPTSYPAVAGMIAGRGSFAPIGTTVAYALALNSAGKPFFSISDGALNPVVEDTAPLPLNSWSHVAGTFDSPNHRVILWVNGEQVASSATTVTATQPLSLPFTVGNTAAPSTASYQYIGLVDEVRLSRALRYPSLATGFVPERHFATVDGDDVALFHFDEAGGSYAVDASATANDGVLPPGASYDPRCQYYRCGSIVTSGGTAYTQNAPQLSPGGSFTLEAYVQPLDLSASDAIDSAVINVIDRAQNLDGPFSYHMFIRTSSKLPAFEVSCDGTSWITAEQGSGTPMALRSWTHLAGVVDIGAHEVILYRDGSQVASAGLGGCTKASDSGLPLLVASFFHGFGRFQGFVDEVRLSSTIRYPSGTTLYQMPALEFDDDGSTLALYHYDDTKGAFATDSSSYMLPAMLQGSVVFDTLCY